MHDDLGTGEAPHWASDARPEREAMSDDGTPMGSLWDRMREEMPGDLKLVRDSAADMLAHGLQNFWGICAGAAILVGGLWLAVATSTGG